MATRVAAVGEVTGVEEMERRLVWLVEQVEREKEKTRDTFQQLHNLLTVREEGVLRELDGVAVEARQELKAKRELLQELQAAKESTERELTNNKLKDVLEKNLKTLEEEIREELSKPVKMQERPFRTEDYSLKLRPVWYHGGTGSSVIEDPQQLAIHTKSGNIFVADHDANKIQVFDESGYHLYYIPTRRHPIGLCLSEEFICVATDEHKLAKIQISNKKTIKSVVTDKFISGMDISDNIYGCENHNQSVSVFDFNLNFLKRIPLKSPHVTSLTATFSIRLNENRMYVMFGWSAYCLQVFSQDGQLIRSVIPSSDIKRSYFFSLDQFRNIIIADTSRDEIKIFSNSGQLIHTISNANLTEDQRIDCPVGISVDKQNNIVVAHLNRKCDLIAF